VISVVLASTSASIPQFVAETSRLKAALPPSISQTLQRYEASADFHHPDYEAAALEFYKRHLCRLDPWPEPVLRTMRNIEGNAVYETMNGPNEFMVIGNLKDWDRIDRLSEMTVPTLITVGRYDEITPTCAETMRRRIPNAQMRVFERTSHTARTWGRQRHISRWSPTSRGALRLDRITRHQARRPAARGEGPDGSQAADLPPWSQCESVGARLLTMRDQGSI
jgi:proline-specific peptidase